MDSPLDSDLAKSTLFNPIQTQSGQLQTYFRNFQQREAQRGRYTAVLYQISDQRDHRKPPMRNPCSHVTSCQLRFQDNSNRVSSYGTSPRSQSQDSMSRQDITHTLPPISCKSSDRSSIRVSSLQTRVRKRISGDVDCP